MKIDAELQLDLDKIFLLAIADTVRKPWSDTGLLATPLQVPENFSSIFSPDAIL